MRCCATGPRETGVDSAAARPICRGHVLSAARSQGARDRGQAVRAFHQGRRPEAARLARRADRSRRPRQDRARSHAADPPGDHRRGPAHQGPGRLRAQAAGHPQADPEPAGRAGQEAQAAGHHRSSTCPAFSTRTVVYKGLLLAHDVGRFYRDLHEPAHRVGGGAGASALLHQHLPVLEAGASLPLHRPQRRDQHGARQRQLDECAPPHAWNPNCWAPISTRCGR